MIINRLGRLLLCILPILYTPMTWSNTDIAVVFNKDIKAYQHVVKSFTHKIEQTMPDIDFISADSKGSEQLTEDVELVLALGSNGLKKALASDKKRKIITTMIFDDTLFAGKENVAGVILKSSILSQLNWHKKILPSATKIGVLYDPKLNQDWVDEAASIAKQLGLEILAVPVDTPQNLPSALKLLGREAHSILGIADKTVYSSKTAKAVLLFSFHNRIPFVGLSDAWVKAGALYALDWAYNDIGEQSALLALSFLDGSKTNIHSTINIDKNEYILNLKTAKQLKLSFPPATIADAIKVYK